MLHIRYLRLLLALFSVALLLAQGCRDINETICNDASPPGTMQAFAIYIRIDGAGTTFPEVTSWYENRVPEITARPDMGDGWFRLKWNVTMEPGDEYHIGCTFAQSQTIKRGCTWWWLADREMAFQDPGAQCDASVELRTDPLLGLVVVVSNLSSDLTVTVSELQGAVTSDRLELDSLYWGSAGLEALSWEDIAPFPFSLPPGADTSFDIDDDQLPPGQWALIRCKSGIQSPYDCKQLVAQESTDVLLGMRIPTLTEWGLIIFGVVLLGFITWVFLRRRKVAGVRV